MIQLRFRFNLQTSWKIRKRFICCPWSPS